MSLKDIVLIQHKTFSVIDVLMVNSLKMPSREDVQFYLDIGHYLFIPFVLLVAKKVKQLISEERHLSDARASAIADGRDIAVMEHAEKILADHQKHDDKRFAELGQQAHDRQSVVMSRIDGLASRIDQVLLRQA